MVAHAFLIEVRLLTDRYHGSRDWPPSPFRLFQALVAGAYGGRWKSESLASKNAAFQWLERLDAPCTAAPPKRVGRSTIYYVPNNDLDSKGGDPRRAADIRVAKEVTPLFVERHESLLYAWPFEEGVEHAQTLSILADRLHTLGRGLDAAFARAAVVTWSEAEDRLRSHGGVVARPTLGQGQPDDPMCPSSGSLESLATRHCALATRFEIVGSDTLFRQPPKAEFRTIGYNRASRRFLFELRTVNNTFRPAPQATAAELAAMVRVRILSRLREAMPAREVDVHSAVEGGLSSISDRGRRIRVIPLPTIGHPHASAAIRRVLVEVPPSCPIVGGDVAWALSGQLLDPLTRVDSETGEVVETQLVPSTDVRMLQHYGFDSVSRRWRTVTPVVLEVSRPKSMLRASDRARFTAAAAQEVAKAVRDAGLPTGGLIIHAQREPFHTRGLRSDQFNNTGSSTRALFHAELIFQEPVAGPIVLGAGEYEGLGIFRPTEPARRVSGRSVRAPDTGGGAEVARFIVKQGPSIASTIRVADLMRLALMSKLGDRCPPEISGRSKAGPLRHTPEHAHAFYLPEDADRDGIIDHIVVYCSRGFGKDTRRAMELLEKLWGGARYGSDDQDTGEWRVALQVFSRPESLRTSRIVGFSREWTSVTPYLKPRYDRKPARAFDARVASYEEQITREWRKRFESTPVPEIQVIHEGERFTSPNPARIDSEGFIRTRGGRGGHQPDVVGAFLRLTFEQPTAGPFALGKHAHFGMGLFERTNSGTKKE